MPSKRKNRKTVESLAMNSELTPFDEEKPVIPDPSFEEEKSEYIFLRNQKNRILFFKDGGKEYRVEPGGVVKLRSDSQIVRRLIQDGVLSEKAEVRL